jgi:hypothetical protein
MEFCLQKIGNRFCPFINLTDHDGQFFAQVRGEKTVNERHGDYVRVEVFTAVSMKNSVFWDVTPCESCKNRNFGGT